MPQRNPPWTRDELILALDLYLRIGPFKLRENHPEIIRLSAVINQMPIHATRPDAQRFRNPNGVFMKIRNFLRFDPSYKGKGLSGGGHLDEKVWNEFYGNRERLHRLAQLLRSTIESGELIPIDPQLGEEDDAAPEGEVLLRLHKTRERNPALAKRKKERVLQKHGALLCEVCGFNFVEVYGQLGVGFIECHHKEPLSQLGRRATTRLEDLALVCPNCHRMLHRGGDLLTIEALRAIVASQTGRAESG